MHSHKSLIINHTETLKHRIYWELTNNKKYEIFLLFASQENENTEENK